MAIVWYVLIHVSLGMIGFEVFRFNNLGATWCVLAGVPFQGYAVWELHRLAWPRFLAAQAEEGGDIGPARRAYWKRLGRLFVFRLSAFSMLTLLVASLVRQAGG